MTWIIWIYCRNEMMLFHTWAQELLLFPVADDPSLGKQVSHFRFIFTARGKNKQKMPKSPRTSTPGERKALRSKAWSEVTLLLMHFITTVNTLPFFIIPLKKYP